MSSKQASAKPQADAESSTGRFPKQKRKSVYSSDAACRHSVFTFTPKRTRQICVSCGARRSINIKEDNTATVGKWKVD